MEDEELNVILEDLDESIDSILDKFFQEEDDWEDSLDSDEEISSDP